jgi:predicted nucleic acid-binding protein
MVIEVVDTNVWVMIDKIPPASEAERQCVLACVKWGKAFNEGTDDHKIAVDMAHKILNEYRANIKKGGLAEQYLNKVLSQPITRLAFVEIVFDAHGHAVVLDNLISDPKDRKWVAVALKFDPPLPILNATDTDWIKDKAKLAQANIEVKELCGVYIAEKLK